MFSLSRDSEAAKEMKYREIQRIIDLPINLPLTKEIQARFSTATLLPNAEIDSLLPAQVDAIVAYLRTGGLFGYISVGQGKALISVACAAIAYRKGLRKIILFIPPKLTIQTEQKVLPWLRKQISVNLPVHILSGKNADQRLALSKADSGLFIMSWSQLQTTDTDELLRNIAPELFIADEAHYLANPDYSRTRRVSRYMVANPDTEFIVLSGTLLKKKLTDYWHLMKWCMKDDAPMPRTRVEIDNWGTVLDTTFSEYTSSGILFKLLVWAQQNGKPELERDIAGYRKAYNHRLHLTSGIVFAMQGESVGTSILYTNLPVVVADNYVCMGELQKLRTQLHDLDLSPDGDIIDHAIHKFRHDYELTAGFFNSLVWPTIEKIMKSRSISEAEARELLERSKDYLRAEQELAKATRNWLMENECEGLDTPLLLGTSMYHHGSKHVGTELFTAWKFKRSVDFDGRIDRDKDPVLVCDYKLQAALKWGKKVKKGQGAIIWYYNEAMGKWLYELMKAAGLPVVLCDAGPIGTKAVNDESNYNKIMICSMSSYKEGLNLQMIEHTYFLQFPRAGHWAEQIIGRNHRTGCKFDELTYHTCFSNDFDHQMYSAVLADALFQHQTGSPHKLIYGSYDPLPKISSSSVLKEQGIISHQLDRTVEIGLNKMFK